MATKKTHLPAGLSAEAAVNAHMPTDPLVGATEARAPASDELRQSKAWPAMAPHEAELALAQEAAAKAGLPEYSESPTDPAEVSLPEPEPPAKPKKARSKKHKDDSDPED